jgi:isopenicillin N synthase-like dioxygenase
MPAPVVSIPYSDLVNFASGDGSEGSKKTDAELIDKVGQAFGSAESALGILAVTGVPLMQDKRQRLLPMARQVALLEDKSEVVCEASKYQTGWSHGKEIFAGKPDLAKGSFYANPLLDDLSKVTEVRSDVKEANPGFFAPNVWPDKSVPELEVAFKELGRLVVDVGRLLAKPCDAYVSRECPGYASGNLSTVLTESKFCKARLLHYFAVDRAGASDGDFSDWCGWHNDHVRMYQHKARRLTGCPCPSCYIFY